MTAIETMMDEWNSPIYMFFSPVPEIIYVKGHQVHVFRCLAKSCKQSIWRFLDKSDAKSTGNMRQHVKNCWGEDVLKSIDGTKSIAATRDTVKSYSANMSITSAFTRAGKGCMTYSHRQHTKTETR